MSTPTSNRKRARSADAALSKRQRTKADALWECGEYCITLVEKRGNGAVVVSHLHDLTEREFLIISKLNGTDHNSVVKLMGQEICAQSLVEFLEMKWPDVQGDDVPEAVKLLRDLIRPGLLRAIRKPSTSHTPLLTHHRNVGHLGIVIIKKDNALLK